MVITQSLVLRLNGRIEVNSTAGKGTEVVETFKESNNRSCNLIKPLHHTQQGGQAIWSNSPRMLYVN